MVGEVGFSGVKYYPSTATLSGTLHTFAGDYPINNIYLPLKPVEFIESLENLTTTDSLTLTVRSGSLLYKPGSIWWMNDISHFPYYVFNIAPLFNSIDMTLADTYTYEVIDSNNSSTFISNIDVKAGLPSMNHSSNN
jgi:hypothetical protein